ncbi:MAG: hypothetical protein LC660_08790 [Desulfobacteraceae bacterium]|nr:hypothetical protein [Desulfobacteraceae bacterium]
MTNRICIPQTFRNHPAQWELQRLLQALFKAPDPRQITRQVADFLRHHPLPADDFPLIPGTYTRSILLRAENRFEGMAARWSSGSVSAIHGHPSFTLYYVVSGHLACDNYTRRGSHFLTRRQKPVKEEDTAGLHQQFGKTVLETKCVSCHSRERIVKADKDREQWEKTIRRMIKHSKDPAYLSDEEKDALLEHLLMEESKPL